jgi:hypothetical protein
MGNGLEPGPYDDPSDPTLIDEGTLARIESPTPGPVGLDSRGGGTTRQNQPSMADRIVAYPRQRQGDRVGDGECFTLADRALRNAGARSAADYDTVTPDADYVWGSTVSLADVRPGDIIQFRDYQYEREVETRSSTSIDTTTETEERPHHTAIVERVGANGSITVLEQNGRPGAPVTRKELFFSNTETTSGNQTVRIRVRGTFWFYRPQSR